MTKISAVSQLATAVPSQVEIPLANTTPNPNANAKTTLRKLAELAGGVDDLGTTGGAIAIDFSTGEYLNKKVSLNANAVFTFAGGVEGLTYVVAIKTNGFTVTFPSNVAFFDGTPTFSNPTVYQPVQLYYQGS